jgi:hypothetical protein
MDAHGMEVSSVVLLDVSMNLCDECCVTIDISIVTKLDRSKGQLVPYFPSSKVPLLSPKQSMIFSRLGLGLSCQRKPHEFIHVDEPESPVSASKTVAHESRKDKKDVLALVDLMSPGKVSPILTSSATLSGGSPVIDRMSRLHVHPSLLLRKLGSSIHKGSSEERGGSQSPGVTRVIVHEGRQEREQLWSREPILMPSLIDSMKKVSILKGESSVLLGLIRWS